MPAAADAGGTLSARHCLGADRSLQWRRPASANPITPGGTIAAINVTGNRRIETDTIIAYMVAQVGQPFDQQSIDQSVKTLYATGLFQTVQITRDGNDLDVNVVENPTVTQVFFSGNKAVADKDAQAAVELAAQLRLYTAGGRG